jgi:signal transduction histidine kinase/GAF domain-containing protein
MVLQLKKLPPSTQKILQLAACIGNQFDLATLAIIAEQSEVETSTNLWKALQEGLILPNSDIYKFYQTASHPKLDLQRENISAKLVEYKFLHDRVQQAAYSLIRDEDKQSTHLKIGQLILTNTSELELEERIFTIVNKLNIGHNLIIQPLEREKLVQLNLIAARKAKNSTAYEPAIKYLEMGIKLLTKDCWQTQYEITKTLYEEAASVAYLSGNYPRVEQLANIFLSHTDNLIDKIRIYEIQIAAAKSQSKMLDGIKLGLGVLQQLGVEFIEKPTSEDVVKALQQTRLLWQNHHISNLLDSPVITDPLKLATMRILTQLVSSAYLVFPKLLPFLIFKQIDLSILYGNCTISAFAYADYGTILCGIIGDIDAGYEFGKLALNILERFPDKTLKSRTYYIVNCYIKHWREPIINSLQPLLEGYEIGLETGDLECTALNLQAYCNRSYHAGQEITTLISDMEIYQQVIDRIKQESVLDLHNILYQTVLNLLGRSQHPCELVGDVYNENIFLPLYQEVNNRTAIFLIFYNKTVLSYLFGQYQQAIHYATLTSTYIDSANALLEVALFYFYYSLICLASDIQEAATIELRLKTVVANQEKLKKWASHCPNNYLHKFHLVEAEYNRVLNNKLQAIEYYDLAIAGAKDNGYLQEEALANELAAKFYLNWGKEKIAQAYMQEAYYCYARWGATAKIDQLATSFPQLLQPILQQQKINIHPLETITVTDICTPTDNAGISKRKIANVLDFSSILKAYQVISGEIELSKLLASLLSIVIENAGADKCVLILLQDEHLLIQGLITQVTKPVVLQKLAIEKSQDIPLKLIYKVKHNQQTLVLLDVSAEATLANDPYIIRQQPQSILCTPILYQGKLLGILYLENNLVTGAFTSDRVELLNLLCAQAAISLENARLYESSQEYAQQLTQSLTKLQASELRFQNLANNIPGMVYQFRLDPDGSTSTPYISSGCWDLYGLDPESVMAGKHNLYALHHPDDHPAIAQAVAYSAENLTPFMQEWRVILPSGTIKWIQSAARPQRQPDGATLWDGVVIDITAGKQAELALQQKSQELEQVLHNLQTAQLQIVQSEKMSALGSLVAGVAHEMNNPLGFIYSSLQQAKPIFDEIIEHLKLYQEALPNKSVEILKHQSEIDLEYTLDDFPKMLASMTIACERLKNISTSLRTFSRADRDYKVPFNLHEGIDSTILILKHRLKANNKRPAIEVVTNYGNVPEVQCFPGQLNQVFMNILANAIDAIDELSHSRTLAENKATHNWIIITTCVENQRAKIMIVDNGKGMSAEVQNKIFDHLFTTKAVGKGTGLGLAIARQIVEETHGGKLSCHSVDGQGTEFLIELPF